VADTETATRTATVSETETETGALATNDLSDPAQLRTIIQIDKCGAGGGSRTQGGRRVLARATERKRTDCDQPFGIRDMKKNKSLHGYTEREWPGGA